MGAILSTFSLMARSTARIFFALAATRRASVAVAEPTTQSKIEGAFFGALVADALSLGSHYEYDAKVIKKAYQGTIPKYMAPGERMGGTTHGVGWGRQNYHPGQKAGDQTDYGEYNVLVLEHFAARQKDGKPDSSRIVLKDFIEHWKSRFFSESWGAWRCTMSKTTGQQLQQGTPLDRLGGMSNAMALRHAAAFAVYNKEDDIVHAARTTMFTHRNEEALGGGEFFARVAFRLIHNKGLKPREAIEQVAKQMSPWFQEKVKQGIAKFEEATDPAKPLSKEEFVDDLAMTSMARLWDVGRSEPIKVGKASPTEGTLPSSIYIILKYQDDPVGAFKANAMVGGDNASRAVAIGSVLGAYHGVEAIPEDFKTTLNAWASSEALLRKLPLLQSAAHQEL